MPKKKKKIHFHYLPLEGNDSTTYSSFSLTRQTPISIATESIEHYRNVMVTSLSIIRLFHTHGEMQTMNALSTSIQRLFEITANLFDVPDDLRNEHNTLRLWADANLYRSGKYRDSNYYPIWILLEDKSRALRHYSHLPTPLFVLGQNWKSPNPLQLPHLIPRKMKTKTKTIAGQSPHPLFCHSFKAAADFPLGVLHWGYNSINPFKHWSRKELGIRNTSSRWAIWIICLWERDLLRWTIRNWLYSTQLSCNMGLRRASFNCFLRYL